MKKVVFILAIVLCSCSPRVVTKIEKVIEYRDRVVTDTAVVEIPVEVEKIVTRDTLSHLENTYAKSDASVSGGFLSHSLESKPQYIRVPVEIHVTDTVYKEAEIRIETKEVIKALTWWQKLRINGFWWLLVAVVALLLWTFRKFIFK